MRTVIFENVGRKYTKSFTCADCGKVRTSTEEFFETISPFNKGPDGQPKTREQIIASIRAKIDQWQPGPTCGCLKRAAIDERPEKRAPDVECAPYPDDIVARLNEIKEEISAINAELNRRFVGTPFTIDGRQAYVTGCQVDLCDCDIMVNVWTSKKKNPLERYDWEYIRLFKVLQSRDAS